MTAERDTHTRIVLSWLREDAHENAERVLLRVLDEVDTTPQRRTWWPAGRFEAMPSAFRMAAAAVAVLVIAVATLWLAAPGEPGGQATPSPSPSATPAERSARPLGGQLAPGDYFLQPFSPPMDSVVITFTIAEGVAWTGYEVGFYLTAGSEAPSGAGGAFQVIERLYSDPCHASGRGDIEVGPTVNDIVTAFRANAAYETTDITDTEIDGYAGTHLDLLLPGETELSGCPGGQFIVWEGGPTAQGPNNRWHLRIVDVGLARPVVILTQHFEGTPLRVQQDLDNIAISVRIDT